LKALEKKGVEQLSWVLLTHIHQDHAGGLGDLIKKYPDAQVVCHQKGAAHLAEPSKLWESSKAILGDVAQVYGSILPVPKNNIQVLEEVPLGSGISVIPTPGHASHHQCYIFEDWFFAGELFGAFVPTESGLYLRPATPHRFILEDYLMSMDSVAEKLRDTICFAHYGSENKPKQVLNTAREQLQLWLEIIDRNRKNNELVDLVKILLEEDPILSKYQEFDEAMQKREWTFAINSISGILRYLETKK
jgi:glyoxylase-like metal-dependent hydrolase (beta-lactamase superfamily II)